MGAIVNIFCDQAKYHYDQIKLELIRRCLNELNQQPLSCVNQSKMPCMTAKPGKQSWLGKFCIVHPVKGRNLKSTHRGFGLSGIPENIIENVRTRPDIQDLKIISTETGDDNWGLGRLYEKNQITKQWGELYWSLQGYGKGISFGTDGIGVDTAGHGEFDQAQLVVLTSY